MCSYIDATPDADLYPIKELIVRTEHFTHEALLILLAKPLGEEFWMRLERKPSPGPFLTRLVSGTLDANDIVSTVVDLYCSFVASPVR